MINGYVLNEGRLNRLKEPMAPESRPIWLDLLNPLPHHSRDIDARFGIEVPTRELREEIEESSRLYADGEAIYMTVSLPVRTELDLPLLVPVTFILTPEILVTVHDYEPRAFQTFPQRAQRLDTGCRDSATLLLALLDAVVDRLADILESVGREIEKLSREVLHVIPGEKAHDYRLVLRQIGHHGEVVSHVLQSLVSVERMLVFLGPAASARMATKEARARLKSLGRDARHLTEHANFLAQKISFLLDATLGMIGIEQNDTIKIFSVAAVVFLPPTLIASIYGMNFVDMPELSWYFGYPFALGLMICSAWLSYWIFKQRGWL
ncbi:magnesium transporter CorA family protein [Amaricoccus solimangrovi]|uniref:Magnesium transport protein CorA n=1 Tax=Amaricoccus solimangrovi TaxID=2589815 RepID=A0A501X0F2_9RHOB|nr:magnesium transporter CorA family protein [Amaricoccus solimangrovi]TPE53131.1 magnesium transporter [Amaricoccus solimangrovi]